MARKKTLREQNITVTNRIAILRAKFDELARDERDSIKNTMSRVVRNRMDSALNILRNNTPDREEDALTWAYRERAYDKKQRGGRIGEPEWLVKRSPNPSIRQHGITLRQGWIRPVIDFVGSGVNRIGLNIRFANIAPYARLALLGEYNRDSWDINVRDQGAATRKVMMWVGSDGKYRFVWAQHGPVQFNRPRKLVTLPMEMAEVELSRDIPKIIDEIQETISKEFEIR